MKIGSKDFDFKNEYYIMGILNVTPDSFSDGGKYVDMAEAKKQVSRMIAEGASIIDVGGESTRPNHTEVDASEEMDRVVPVIKMIRENFDTVISLDTSKAAVAKAGIEVGADMINDVWGFKRDKDMARVVAESGLPVCLMHNQLGTDYDDLLADVRRSLDESVKIALDAGVEKENIILDVGIGFGKTTEQNLELLNKLEDFVGEYPLLLGTSRKSVIGNTLDLPVDERVEGTIVTTVMGMMKGVRIFRVHDVKENMRALKMTHAIMKSGVHCKQ